MHRTEELNRANNMLHNTLSKKHPRDLIEFLNIIYLAEQNDGATRYNLKSVLDLIYSDKYLITCDATNNPPEVIDNNELRVRFTSRDENFTIIISPDGLVMK